MSRTGRAGRLLGHGRQGESLFLTWEAVWLVQGAGLSKKRWTPAVGRVHVRCWWDLQLGVPFGQLYRHDWAYSQSSRPEIDLGSHRMNEITQAKPESEKNLEGPVNFKDRCISGSRL